MLFRGGFIKLVLCEISPELTSECSPVFNFGESSRFLSKGGSIVASGSPHLGPL
jgi:hypothetical protein